MRHTIIFILSLLTITITHAQVKYPSFYNPSGHEKTQNQIPNTYFPVIGVWVWGPGDLMPEGYKQSIDDLSNNSPFNLIVPFLRFHDKELLDNDVYNQVKLASEYANARNIGLLPDLDVRSARRAFKKQYPDELQEMLRLKVADLSETGNVEASVTSIKKLNDHYSGGLIPDYDALQSKLLRVYGYQASSEGIIPESVQDITAECELLYFAEDSIRIQLPASGARNINQACIMVSFTLFYPDVFSPNLLSFQRDILKKYSDIPLPGACKDEWGFPPYYPRFYTEKTFDFWYSDNMAKVYNTQTENRNLLDDCFLMAFSIKGKEIERQMAVNHFTHMTYQRNVEIENDFYDAVKEYYGPDAVVTVHSTWWPYPDFNEMKKNGLSWWASKRDWAQTDEVVPFGVRTALSKKWNSPIWYNMYYTAGLSDQVWGSVLAGGRIMYLRYYSLYDQDIMRAENRLRLLNYISKSPLDCQVAVIFGHNAAMNWAGWGFNDVGMQLVDTLWYTGFPTDLIPTSEINNGSLKMDADGYICYGPQRYSAVVLYQPEFENETTSDFFKKAANSKTKMLKIGSWTHNFSGKPVDEKKLLPSEMMSVQDYKSAFFKILEVLKSNNIMQQSPATSVLDTSYYKLRGFNHTSHFPSNTGNSFLIDGTRIMIAATNNVSGDPIKSEFKIKNFDVSIDAIGVAGVRLDDEGKLDAMAVSDLKYFKAGKMVIKLEKRMDIVLWRNEDGNYEGVIQAKEKGIIPKNLLKITKKWSYLQLPEPPKKQAGN